MSTAGPVISAGVQDCCVWAHPPLVRSNTRLQIEMYELIPLGDSRRKRLGVGNKCKDSGCPRRHFFRPSLSSPCPLGILYHSGDVLRNSGDNKEACYLVGWDRPQVSSGLMAIRPGDSGGLWLLSLLCRKPLAMLIGSSDQQ